MLISAAVTGTCECVSVLGPALGGGHGWLQGYYGLVADQFVALVGHEGRRSELRHRYLSDLEDLRD